MPLKMDLKLILSFICIAVLMCDYTFADKGTVERIRKHQEWLRQRSQGRNNLVATSKPKKSIELLNLWRFNKDESANSINEVYPENDNIITAAVTTAKAIAATATTANTIYNATTNKTIWPTTTDKSQKSTTIIPTPTMETSTAPAFAKAVERFNNSIAQFDSNFILKSSTSNDFLSNEILATTTPFTTTSTTTATFKPAVPVTVSTTTAATTTTLKTTTRKPKPRPYPRWGNWGEWSACSRSCGGGISHQLRKCINRNSLTGKLHLSRNCIGVYKRYQLCNEQPCPSHLEDFRAVQCSSYDNIDFQGQHFTWEPYVKDDAECELNCKPLDMKYFATLNASVIDGTACEKPAEYYRSNYKGRAMCIDGICKAPLRPCEDLP